MSIAGIIQLIDNQPINYSLDQDDLTISDTIDILIDWQQLYCKSIVPKLMELYRERLSYLSSIKIIIELITKMTDSINEYIALIRSDQSNLLVTSILIRDKVVTTNKSIRQQLFNINHSESC